MDFINNAHSGNLSLSRVFWLGFIAPLVPFSVAGNLISEWVIINQNLNGLLIAWGVFLIWYYKWATISLWRCSVNANKKLFVVLGRLISIIALLRGVSWFYFLLEIIRN